MFKTIKNSQILRWPLLAVSRLLLIPIKRGPALLRRAAYDIMPGPYIIAGNREHFVVSTTDKVIGRELFLHGQFDFEKLERALLILDKEGIQKPRHLIDVGANIGSILIPAIKRGHFESATAIEPHPENFKLLKTNIALNEISNSVSLFNMAAGNQNNTYLYLCESDTNSGNHTIGKHGIKVLSTRLDDLKIPLNNSLLWMDIEGYEGYALDGAAKILSAGTPIVTEFNYSYLKKSHCLELFFNHLKNKKIFDLKNKMEESETSINKLIEQYKNQDDFTDILAITSL